MKRFWPQRLWARLATAMAIVSFAGFIVIAGGMATYYLVYYKYSLIDSVPAADRTQFEELYNRDIELSLSDEERAFFFKYWKEPPLSQDLSVLFGFTALALAIAGFLGLAMARRIAGPVADVASTARRLAVYDLSARANSAQSESAGREVEQLVEDINKLAETLELDDKRLREQAASIAHEFRTPLTILGARLHALRDGIVLPEKVEFERLIGQVNGLTRIVEDLRTISLIEAGALSLNLENVELASFLESYAEGLRLHAQATGVEISIQAEPCRANVDRDRLRQIFDNLASNAIRFAGSGGVITISCEKEGNDAVLRVRDSGPGIDPAVLPVAFEHFSSSEKSRSRDTGGSGLGLAVVHGLIQIQKGAIHASNPPGGGALFEIRLPSS